MLLVLKNLLFTLLVPGTAAVCVPLLLAGDRPPALGLLFFLGLALVVTGSAIYARCVWDFAVFGRGTPAPIDPPKKLVVRGLYRYTRNPIYMGVVTVLLGWTFMFLQMTLLIYTLCFGIGFHLLVILYEEPRLTEQFGAEYRDYCTKVGRWLPRFRHQRTA